VDQVSRKESSIEIRHAGGADEFDQVIFACHSDQALNLIEEPTAIEKDILSGLSYQENDVILHCDDTLMPDSKLAWASWNFLAGEQSAEQPPLVTYCMNILQSIKSELPLLVSLNARHKIDPEKILRELKYSHPIYSYQAIQSQSRRREICGVDRFHYCGAYWYSGFHEDGVRSALDVAARFGEKL
jgi:Predicted NAD/FAD-binding protein